MDETPADQEDERETGDICGVENWELVPLVEEARRRFDGEENRRSIVETKISFIVAVDALVISLVGSSLFPDISLIASGALIAPAIVSAIIGISQMRVRIYTTPFADFKEYYPFAKQETENQIYDRILISNIEATMDNAELNTSKYKWLNVCLVLTFVSLLLVSLSPFHIFSQFLLWVSQVIRLNIGISLLIYVTTITVASLLAYSRDVKSIGKKKEE